MVAEIATEIPTREPGLLAHVCALRGGGRALGLREAESIPGSVTFFLLGRQALVQFLLLHFFFFFF